MSWLSSSQLHVHCDLRRLSSREQHALWALGTSTAMISALVSVQLLDALEWCLDLGISCVSVYAFSIDNFKRPPQEVAMLMQLAEEKLEELMQVAHLS